MTPAPIDRRRLFAACAFVLMVGVAMFATLHMRRAAFFLDDYLIDTIVRSVDNPLWFFTQRHFFAEHLHRPMGFASWWLLARIGPGAPVQLAGNALLLAVNGALLATLLARWRVPAVFAALAGAVWISHPGSVVFASWSADRFELLATAFGLACLHAWTAHLAEGRHRASAVWAAAFAAGALLSKESAVLLAPVTLAMAATADCPGRAARLRLMTWTLLVVVGLLLVFAAYRQALGVRMPREVIEANAGLAWTQGIAKWWQHLPGFLLPGADIPAWAGMLTLAVLPALLVALLLYAGLRSHDPGADAAARWPAVVGGVCLLTMPVIQVGHLTLATMVFLDPSGRMTGLFVERFYFQGLMGLVMIACAPLARRASVAPGAGAWTSMLRSGMALGLLALAAWQVHASLKATQAWPRLTGDIRTMARAAAEALHEAGADRHAGCRARFNGAPSPVFAALTEAMVKAIDAKPTALARCIIESDQAPMISLTHISRLGEYPLRVAAGDLPRVGPWVFLRATLADAPASPVTHAWRFDVGSGRFLPAAP